MKINTFAVVSQNNKNKVDLLRFKKKGGPNSSNASFKGFAAISAVVWDPSCSMDVLHCHKSSCCFLWAQDGTITHAPSVTLVECTTSVTANF